MIAKAKTFITERPRASALIAGAVSAFTMPPFGILPLLLVTFPVLHALLAATTKKQAFARAFLFALGYHVLGLYWIASSMTVDLAAFWWAIPLSVLALPAYFALYTGLAGSVYAIIRDRAGTRAQPFFLAVLLLVAAVAQSRILTGFEWNLFGQAWHHVPHVLQSVSLFGIHALTLLTMLLAFAPVWWRAGAKHIAIFFVLVFMGLGIWGAVHLQAHQTAYQPGIQLRLVQPNIPQELKWDPERREQNFETTMAMADLSAALTPTHIIWPEAATPFILNRAPEARLQIGLRTPGKGLTLLGTPWRDDLPEGQRVYHNSMVAVDEVGTITARFDKQHLVPFGEYFPLRTWLNSLGININAIAAGSNDYTPGPGLATLALKGLPPVSPLICYEVIFSGKVARDDQRPAWLLNLTNDAWFGTTTGPYQHFEIARLRAIEEGLPLVRVANTGISGVIDAYGRVLAKTRLNERVAMDHGLPLPAADTTPFSHYRFWPLLVLVLLTFLAGFAFCERRSLNK